jgi:hypothetical protein
VILTDVPGRSHWGQARCFPYKERTLPEIDTATTIRAMKRLLALALAATMAAVMVPSPALAAYSNLVVPSELTDSNGQANFDVTMRNSSNQVIGTYYVVMLYSYYPATGQYKLQYKVCVMDTLIGNGRGVVARVLLKSGTSTSTEVIKVKGGTNTYNCTGENATSEKLVSFPVWAVDVDHGEDWSGVPYQYTGHYDRYVRSDQRQTPSSPAFYPF